MKNVTKKIPSIERRPTNDMHDESTRRQIGRITQVSSDPTWTENRGNGNQEPIVNNPMLNTDMMVACFARAIERDVILSDTLAQKNPFKPGCNPSSPRDYNKDYSRYEKE